MPLYTFPGGVHAHDTQKQRSSDKEIIDAPLPEKVYIPLIQHIGAPSTPLVEKGDTVKKGQKIAEAGGFVSVPQHSSVSGKVLGIKRMDHPFGKKMQVIEIQSDGQDEWANDIQPRDNWEDLSVDELRKIISDAGICGMGGAGFPTHVKLSPPKDKPIDTLILNGVECEPYLTADHRLMLEQPEKILNGTQILMKILGINSAWIGIEVNKPDAIQLMKEKTAGTNINIAELKVKYPQGAEKQLIQAITGREVPPPPGLPMDVGCVVQNVGTVAAVWEAVTEGKPLIERITTVTGAGVKNPQSYKVRIGTLFSELIEHAGGEPKSGGKVISGGPMMGIAQYSTDVPVLKGSSGILVLPQTQVKREMPHTCIRCARCVDACPMGLTPTEIAKFVDNDEFERAADAGLMTCIKCGSCSFICPSKIPLVHKFQYGQAQYSAMKKKQ